MPERPVKVVRRATGSTAGAGGLGQSKSVGLRFAVSGATEIEKACRQEAVKRMAGLDTAIREAIDRANARDAVAREQVYRTARTALENSIARHPDLDEATIEGQRRRFDEIISEIEAEKAAAEDRIEPEPAPVLPANEWPATTAGPAKDDAGTGRAADIPSLDSAEVREPRPETAAPDIDLQAERQQRPEDDAPFAATIETPGAPPPKKERSTRKARKPQAKEAKKRDRRSRGTARIMSTLFLLVSLLVFGGLVLWLVNATGLLGDTASVSGNANSFRKFDAASSGDNSGLMTEHGFGRTWSPVFVPGKGDTVKLGPSAKMEAVSSERGKAVRLTSATPDQNGDVRIAIPAKLLAAMAGTSSIIALNVRALDGHPTQISVECDFGALGHCGRRRFDVAVEMTDVVFRVDLPKAQAGSGGTLLVNTDIGGKGRSIDLFAVGVRREAGAGKPGQ